MKAVNRILAYDDGQINQHRDATWQQRRDNKMKGKPKPSNSLPDGTFKQTSPGGIANTLKTKSKDFDQAMRRLNNYENGRGRDMKGMEKRTVDDAKDALRDAFGKNKKPNPNTKKPASTSPAPKVSGGLTWDENATVGFNDENALMGIDAGPNPLTAFQYSFNAMPAVHNLDDSSLKTGLDEELEQKPTHHVSDPPNFSLNAVARLMATDE